MKVRRVTDLLAYEFAHEFKLAVYNIARKTPVVERELRYKSQLFEAASGVEHCIVEGHARRSDGEFAQFLRYALGSLEEAVERLRDGVNRGYFTTEVCDSAFTYARRCRIATRGLLKSIQRKRRDDDDPPPARTRRPRR